MLYAINSFVDHSLPDFAERIKFAIEESVRPERLVQPMEHHTRLAKFHDYWTALNEKDGEYLKGKVK